MHTIWFTLESPWKLKKKKKKFDGTRNFEKCLKTINNTTWVKYVYGF